MSIDTTVQSDEAQAAVLRNETRAVVLLLAYFAARLIYIAATVDHSIPPDEVTHMGIVRLHAATWGLPADTADSYQFGLMTHTPRLYYYLMGRCLNLNAFGVDDVLYLRLCHIPLGLLCVWFGYLWMRMITESSLVRVVFVAIVTNTLMFSFVSASVSYDNLTNCLAAASLFLCFRFMEVRDVKTFAAFVLALSLGGLTKATFLPMATVLFLLVVVNEWRAFIRLLRRQGTTIASTDKPSAATGAWNWGTVLLCSAAAVFALLNVRLYGTNLVRYRAIVPSMVQVLPLEICLQNRIFARNYVVSQYQEGKLTFEEAREMIEQNLQHVPNRAGIHGYLVFTRRYLTGKESVMSFGRYVPHWFISMTRSIYGVDGHRRLFLPEAQRRIYYFFPAAAAAIFAGICVFPRWRAVGRHRRMACLFYALVAVAFYVIILFQFNYRHHMSTAHPTVGLAGRYLFPVLLPYYGLLAQLLIDYFPRRVQAVPAVGLAAFFIMNDFPFYLSSASFRLIV